jgi:hypothetical protein
MMTLAVNLPMAGQQTLSVTALYCVRSSPCHPASCSSPYQLGCIVLYHLQHLFPTDTSNCRRRSGTSCLTITYPVVLLGDFNAKHFAWGSDLNDDRGVLIYDLSSRHNLSLPNCGANTHFSFASGTINPS